ncbi:MAG: AEC family transporter [Deltaproteobacteria bacterium]|nr:AEC family transporter [Deltaproteobacteria bacterium]MBI3755731.1 AEC family transporter [Deltaproteobacteria bacterium]
MIEIMPILKVSSIVLPVFSIIGIGFVFARFKKISLESVIEILLYLTIPFLVISSLTKKTSAIGELTTVSLAACGVVLGTGIMSFLYLRIINRKELRGFYLPIMFMNSGNMAFPLALLAFGEEGLAIAIIYYVAISILVYLLGIYIAKGQGGFSEIFKLPLIYASITGITLNLTDTVLPTPVLSTVEILGNATIPLMLVSLGYRLHSIHLTSLGISIAGALIRIGGGALIAYWLTVIFDTDGLNQKIIILSSSMPSAVINFIVSYKYELVTSIISISTVLSLITTPIILAMMI